MAAELRDEFENYVRKLTTEISKKIFLKKLEELYSKYESEYEKYTALFCRTENACSAMEQEVKTVDTSIKKIEKETKSSLKAISDDIGALEAGTNKLFADMKTMNEQSRKQFITELSYYIERYKGQIAKTINQGCEQISDRIAGVITPENLQQFIDTLEEHTRETKELASFINETYKEDIEKNIQLLTAGSLEVQRQAYASLSADMEKLIEQFGAAEQSAERGLDEKVREFSDAAKGLTHSFIKQLTKLAQEEKISRNEAIKRQIELIEKIEPSEEKFRRFQREVEDLHRTVEYLQSENTRNYTSMREILSDFMREQREAEQKYYEDMQNVLKTDTNRGWRIYMAVSNTLILLSFALMVYFQVPWGFLESWEAGMIAGTFLTVIFLQTFIIMKLGRRKQAAGNDRKSDGGAAGDSENGQEDKMDGR